MKPGQALPLLVTILSAGCVTIALSAACGSRSAERGADPGPGPTSGMATDAGAQPPDAAATGAPTIDTPVGAAAPGDAAPPPALSFRTVPVDGTPHLQVEPGGLDLGAIDGSYQVVGSIDLCGPVPTENGRRRELVQDRAPGKAPVTVVRFDRPGHQQAVVFVTREAEPLLVLDLSLPKLTPGGDHRADWELARSRNPGEPLNAVVTLTSFSCTGKGKNKRCRRPFRDRKTHQPRNVDCR